MAPALQPGADPTRPSRSLRARSLTGAILTLSIVAVACLPSGARGTGAASASASVPAATVAAPTPTPTPERSGPTPRPSFVRPTQTPAPTFLVYTVVTGDNLNTIARKFGTTARSIAFWNRTTYPTLDPEGDDYRPNVVRIGWTLLIVPNTVFDEQTLPQPS